MAFRRFQKIVGVCLPASVMAASVAHGMSGLSDAELESVQARDGIVISASIDSSIDSVEIRSDVGQPYEASFFLEDISIGSTLGGPANVVTELDVGGNGAGAAYVALSSTWNDMDLQVLGARHGSAPGTSFGSFALKGDGSLRLGVQGGLFNASANNASFDLTTSGDWIFRSGAAGSPELSLGNINFGARFTDGAGGAGFGTFGLTSEGLVISAPFMDVDLNFDLLFKPVPTDFDTVGRQSAILFGWEGGIEDALLRVGTGGMGYGTGIGPSGLTEFNVDGSILGTRSEGLNVLAEWNYGSDFAWILGQAGGNRTRVRFFDWQRFSGAPIDFRIPIIVDTVNGPGTGPGGLCFGGNLPTEGSLASPDCGAIGGVFENVAPEVGALAVLIRDGRLHAFNSQVEVIDPGTAIPSEIFNWSLLYTFGKIDSNIYLSGVPGGGIEADILLAIQSPGYWSAAQTNFSGIVGPQIGDAAFDPRARWATNTHFMIADTNTAVDVTGDGAAGDQFGIGIVNADLLWKADDLSIDITSTGGPDPRGVLRLETSTLGQYRFRGLFGGGNLLPGGPTNGLERPVRVALVDVNLLTSFFRFDLLSAPIGQEFMGFASVFDFAPGAYLSIAEPSQPSSDFRVQDISGRLAWENGEIKLTSASDNPSDNKPRLTILNDIAFGATAGGTAFRANIAFSGATLGSSVIPAGRWAQEFTLKKQ